MSKEINKKLTLEDFIAKASNKYKNRKMSVDIPVEGFGEITFNRPSDNDSLQYLNTVGKAVKADKEGNIIDTNLSIIIEASKILVYKTCMYLHNSELQEKVEAKDPYDTPFRIFGIEGTMEIAEKISDSFDNEGGKKTIKNLSEGMEAPTES